ncbi:MAG TPA: DUF2304 domain-containing protein [Bryobacteraceae bacterium]|nr:DUF2304 domain-containing protein [Bryobacteraceae bacterium]
MARLLAALGAFSVAMIVGVLASVRRAHIRVEYSVSWLAAAFVLLGLSASDAPLRRMGQVLGVPDAPAALLIAAGCVFVVVLYRSSLLISHLKDSNIALAQRVAILEYRLESLDEKIKAAAAN